MPDYFFWDAEYNEYTNRPLYDTGSSFQVDTVGTGRLVSQGIGDKDFDYGFDKIVFHAPSEHKFENETRAMEVQFVNSRFDFTHNHYHDIVIAITYHTGDTRDALLDFYIDKKTGKVNTNPLSLNVGPYMDALEKKNYYNYMGSQTQPDCTEHVEWIVLEHSLSATQDQINAFSSHWAKNHKFASGNGNNRAV